MNFLSTKRICCHLGVLAFTRCCFSYHTTLDAAAALWERNIRFPTHEKKKVKGEENKTDHRHPSRKKKHSWWQEATGKRGKTTAVENGINEIRNTTSVSHIKIFQDKKCFNAIVLFFFLAHVALQTPIKNVHYFFFQFHLLSLHRCDPETADSFRSHTSVCQKKRDGTKKEREHLRCEGLGD